LNPAENIWQFMRDNWLSNRVFKSYDDIVNLSCEAWNNFIEQPWKIMSYQRHEILTLGGFPFGVGSDSRRGEGDSPCHQVFSFETTMMPPGSANWLSAAGIRARSVGCWR